MSYRYLLQETLLFILIFIESNGMFIEYVICQYSTPKCAMLRLARTSLGGEVV